VPFPEFYVKKAKWFRRTRKLFRRRVRTKQSKKSNDFNYLHRPLGRLNGSSAGESGIRTQKLWNSMNRISLGPTLVMARNCFCIAPRHSISTGGTGRGQWQFRSGKTRHEPQSGWPDAKLKLVGPLCRKYSGEGRR
jgi:hypothetical protein